MIKASSRYFANAHRISDHLLNDGVAAIYSGQWLSFNSDNELVVADGSAKAYMTISDMNDKKDNVNGPAVDNFEGTLSRKAAILAGPYKVEIDQYNTDRNYIINAPLKVGANGQLVPFGDVEIEVDGAATIDYIPGFSQGSEITLPVELVDSTSDQLNIALDGEAPTEITIANAEYATGSALVTAIEAALVSATIDSSVSVEWVETESEPDVKGYLVFTSEDVTDSSEVVITAGTDSADVLLGLDDPTEEGAAPGSDDVTLTIDGEAHAITVQSGDDSDGAAAKIGAFLVAEGFHVVVDNSEILISSARSLTFDGGTTGFSLADDPDYESEEKIEAWVCRVPEDSNDYLGIIHE